MFQTKGSELNKTYNVQNNTENVSLGLYTQTQYSNYTVDPY